MISYTLYRSLYDLDGPIAVTESWPDLLRRFGTHGRYAMKHDARGFGPYRLDAPPAPCKRHRGDPRTEAHRCDVCVTAMSLAVFDVDVGTEAQVDQCDAALAAGAPGGVARLWYSSYSYDPTAAKPSMRLVMPLSRPVAPEYWSSLRTGLLRKYSIPADAHKCSGLSHFYYAPAARPGAEVVWVAAGNAPVDVDSFTLKRSPVGPILLDLSVDLPEEPTGPVDTAPLVEALKRRHTSLARRGDDRAEWLGRLLAGKPLADAGSRNEVTFRVAGILAHALPGTPKSVLKHLLRQSIDAMIAAGSSVTWDKVDRMLESAMRSKAERDERDRQIEARLLAAAAARSAEYKTR